MNVHFSDWAIIALILLAGTMCLLLIPLIAYAVQHSPDFAGLGVPIQQQIDTIADPVIRQQMTVPVFQRNILPVGLFGLFAAVIIGSVIGYDDTYLHSRGNIFVQDVLLPRLTQYFPNVPFPEKFPVNGQWGYFIAMASASVIYIIVSLLVRRKMLYNFDRILHRGAYVEPPETVSTATQGSMGKFNRLIGITADFTGSERWLFYATHIRLDRVLVERFRIGYPGACGHSGNGLVIFLVFSHLARNHDRYDPQSGFFKADCRMPGAFSGIWTPGKTAQRIMVS